VRTRVTLLVPGLAILGVLYAQAPQLAFTSRAYVNSPVLLSAIESSTDFGFESVTLRNDGPEKASAVRLRVLLRSGSDEEVVDERRVPIDVARLETKRVVIGMAQIKGLRDHVSSLRQEAALVIITVEGVEFRDGTEWKNSGPFLHLDTYPDRDQKK
jgi:hypothetical protein